MAVGQDVGVVLNCDVSHGFDRLAGVASTNGVHPFRGAVDQVLHYRDVVRRQVPQHADVVLEQAQVDAHRVVVAKIAQLASADHVVQFFDGRMIDKRVVHHQYQTV